MPQRCAHPWNFGLVWTGLVLAWGISSAALAQAQAQNVTLTGMLGPKALLVVDGSDPKALAPGESYRGVRVISTQPQEAVLEVQGQRFSLRVGQAPASVGSAVDSNAATKIVLSAGSGGHFVSSALINGKTVQAMVDTGATAVALGLADAQRMGIDLQRATPVQLRTANGVTTGWRVKLDTVQLGDVTVYAVDAVVTSASMPYVLLGNSFLTRFQMTRTNDVLVLEKRF